jgi:peroxiredoxin (alkyl hydroperoxide reductase subunit C)
MPTPFKPGCKRPEVAKNVNLENEEVAMVQTQKEERKMIKVGQKAPDFELAGYQNGQFLNFKLSELLGKWVLLCFYPGDFTFV